MDMIENIIHSMRDRGLSDEEIALALEQAKAKLGRGETRDGVLDAEPIDAEPIDAEPIDAEPIGAEPIDADIDVRVEGDAGVMGALPAAPNEGAVPAAALSSEVPDAGPKRKPCSVCGEMIAETARKCRFCGTILDKSLKRELQGTPDDDSITNEDIIFGLICFPAAFLVVFESLLKGRYAKAGKMTAIGAVGPFILIVLNVISKLDP